MRKRRAKNNPSAEVANMIAESYGLLYELCECHSNKLYESQSREDVFHETVLYAIHDKNAPKDRKKFINYFQYKFNMILFQTTRDSHQKKEINYADHIQTKEKENE
jgi:hypothetical protein